MPELLAYSELKNSKVATYFSLKNSNGFVTEGRSMTKVAERGVAAHAIFALSTSRYAGAGSSVHENSM